MNNYQNQFIGQNNNQMSNYSNQNINPQNNCQNNFNQPYQNQNQKSGGFINNNNFYQNNQNCQNNLNFQNNQNYQNYQNQQDNQINQNFQGIRNNQNFQGIQNNQNFQNNQNYQNIQRNQNTQHNYNYQNFQGNQNFQGKQNNQNFQGNPNNQKFQGNQNFQNFEGNPNIQNFQGNQYNQKYQNTHLEPDDPSGFSFSVGIYDSNSMNQNKNNNYNNNFNNNNYYNNNYNNNNQYQNPNSFNNMNNFNQNIMQNNMSNSGQNFNRNNMLNIQQQQMINNNGNLQTNNFNNMNNQYNQNKNAPLSDRNYNINQKMKQNLVPPSQQSQPISMPQQFDDIRDNNSPIGRQISQPDQNYNNAFNNCDNFNKQNGLNPNNIILNNPLNRILNSGNLSPNNDFNNQFDNYQNMNNIQNQNNQGQQQNQMNNNLNNNNMQNLINQEQNNTINQVQPKNNLIQNNHQQNINQNNPQQNTNQIIPQQNIKQENMNQNNQQSINNPNKEPINKGEGGKNGNHSINGEKRFFQDEIIMNIENDNFKSLVESIPLESIKKEEKNDNIQKNINQKEEKKYIYQGPTPNFIDDKNYNNQANSAGASLPQLNDYLKINPNNNNMNNNNLNSFGNEDFDDFQLLRSVKPKKNIVTNNIQNNNDNIIEKEKMLTNKGDENEPKMYPKIGEDEYIKKNNMIKNDDNCAPNIYTNKGDEDLSEKYKKKENEINKIKEINQEEEKDEEEEREEIRDIEDEKIENGSYREEELGVKEMTDSDIKIISQEDSLFKDQSLRESVQIDLPKSIHNHSLLNESLSDEICTICLNKKTFELGNKCKNCSLKICDECSKQIKINEFDNRIHNHPLTLLNEENCKCNKCNKELKSNKDFYFICKKCNFYICLNCYNPRRKEEKEEKEEKEDDSLHEHPLENVTEFRDATCQLCEEETNSGVVCETCELLMCQKCAANIYKRKFRKGLHNHHLYLTMRDQWKCKECGSNYTDKISFHCKKCSVDICADCYLE